MNASLSDLMQSLPDSSWERWKYTNLAKALKRDTYAPATPAVEGIEAAGIADAPNWARELAASEPPAVPGGMPLWPMGLAQDVLVIDTPKGQDRRDTAIQGKAGAFLPLRLVIRVADNAELTVFERHEGQGDYWKNQVTQIVLGRGARLRYCRLLDDSAEAVHTQTMHLRQAQDSTYEGFNLTVGGRLTRNEIVAQIEGPGAHCSLNGIQLQRGRQHADTTMLIEHRAPHCTSNQFIRTVLGDQARGVYQGKVHVFRDAQKTDGYQLSNALLLSEGAEMDTKPELEIYADDVKCSHGATTGRLDDEPLFYMRSRGIPEREARALLIGSFLGEVIEKVGDEDIRIVLAERVKTWLG